MTALELEMTALEEALWRQDELLENLLRKELGEKSDKIFDRYSEEMAKIYKDSDESARSQKWVSYGIPRWVQLVQKK